MNKGTAVVRTAVPLIVAAIVSWLADIGFELNDKGEQGLSVAVGGAVALVYYIVVRFAEDRVPIIGALLGSPNPPSYLTKTPLGDVEAHADLDSDDRQEEGAHDFDDDDEEDEDDELGDDEEMAEDGGEAEADDEEPDEDED